MLNHMVYKFCVSDNNFGRDLPTISEFLSSIDCESKFYFNTTRNLVNHVNKLYMNNDNNNNNNNKYLKTLCCDHFLNYLNKTFSEDSF